MTEARPSLKLPELQANEVFTAMHILSQRQCRILFDLQSKRVMPTIAQAIGEKQSILHFTEPHTASGLIARRTNHPPATSYILVPNIITRQKDEDQDLRQISRYGSYAIIGGALTQRQHFLNSLLRFYGDTKTDTTVFVPPVPDTLENARSLLFCIGYWATERRLFTQRIAKNYCCSEKENPLIVGIGYGYFDPTISPQTPETLFETETY